MSFDNPSESNEFKLESLPKLWLDIRARENSLGISVDQVRSSKSDNVIGDALHSSKVLFEAVDAHDTNIDLSSFDDDSHNKPSLARKFSFQSNRGSSPLPALSPGGNICLASPVISKSPRNNGNQITPLNRKIIHDPFLSPNNCASIKRIPGSTTPILAPSPGRMPSHDPFVLPSNCPLIKRIPSITTPSKISPSPRRMSSLTAVNDSLPTSPEAHHKKVLERTKETANMLTYFILADKKQDIKDRIDMSMSRVENCVTSPNFNPELLSTVIDRSIDDESKNKKILANSLFSDLDIYVNSQLESLDFLSLVENAKELQFENLNYPAAASGFTPKSEKYSRASASKLFLNLLESGYPDKNKDVQLAKGTSISLVRASPLESMNDEEEHVSEFSLDLLFQKKEIKTLRSLDLSPFDINALELEVKINNLASANELSSEQTRMLIKEKRLATDVNMIMSNTYITEDEAYKLYEIFSKVTSTDAGEVMLYEEFCTVFDFSTSSLIVQRIFDTFDAYHIRALNFAQFGLGVAILSSKCRNLNLARFTFDVYDLNKNGVIDFIELKAMLESSLRDRGLNISNEEVIHICRNTLRLLDAEQRGYIIFENYMKLVNSNDSILDVLRVSFDTLFKRWLN